MKRCKKLLCLVLALVMALSLCTVAMADDPTGNGAEGGTTSTINSIAFTLAGYAYGATSVGVDVTCTTNSSNPNFPGVQATATIVTYGGEDGGWNNASSPLREGTRGYVAKVVYCANTSDGFSIGTNVVPTMTRNGEPCQLVDANNTNSTAAPVADNGGNYTAYFTLPELTVVSVDKTINFVKTVVKGGDVEPPAATFSFEQVTTDVNVNFNNDQSGDNSQNLPVTSSVSVAISNVATNGAGDYRGTITVTGPQIDVDEFLREGFYVREKNDGAAGWEYDEQVWFLQLKNIYSEEVAHDLGISPSESENNKIVAKKVVKGGNTYVYADGAKWCCPENMTFTNIYTENVVVDEPINRQTVTPAPEAPATKPVASPKTGDMGVALYAAMAVSSVLGMGYVSKKKF